MSWLACRLVYQVCSPVHLGVHTLGMIQRTKLYVPGRAVWGAATSRLTRALYTRPGSPQYQAVGALLRQRACFSCLFPAFEPDQPLLPSWEEAGLSYLTACGSARLSEDELAGALVGTHASTAIDPVRAAAADATLHETEFVSPRRLDRHGPVFFIGYAFLARSSSIFTQQNGVKIVDNGNGDIGFFAHGDTVLFFGRVLQELVVGGEKTYGWGRLRLVDRAPCKGTDHRLWDRCPVEIAEETVRLRLQDSGAPGPVEAPREDLPNWRGVLEPQVGRDWDPGSRNRGAGRVSSIGPVVLAPGARWCGPEPASLTLGATGNLLAGRAEASGLPSSRV